MFENETTFIQAPLIAVKVERDPPYTSTTYSLYMRNFSLLLLIFFSGLSSYAQNTDLDKLKQSLEKLPKQDTAYVNLINRFVRNFNRTSDTTYIKSGTLDSLSQEALTLAKKIDYKGGVFESMFSLIELKLNRGNINSALAIAEESYAKAVELNDKEWQSSSLLYLGNILSFANEPTASLEKMLKAEELARELTNKKILANAERSIGTAYSHVFANYPLGMEWLLRSVHTSEAIGDLGGLQISWRGIGDIYSMLGDNEKALECLQKSAAISDKLALKDPSLINSIGEAYRLMGKYPEAIAAYTEALSIDKSAYNVELYQSNLADVYLRMGNLPEAFNYGFSSLKIATEINDLAGIAWIAATLSKTYLKKNMTDSALYYAQKGLKAAEESNYLEFLRDNSEALAAIYKQKKDFEKAYYYQDLFISYRDSMQNTQVSNKANLLQHEYEMAKTETRITEMAAQKKSQKNFLITSLSLLGLIILIAVLLLRNNRQKQKANTLLQQSYNNVELLEEIGQKITSSLSIEKIIGTVYKNVNTIMDANVFGIGIYNAALKQIDFPSTYEQGEILPAYYNAITDDSRLGVISFTTGKEIIIGNIESEYKKYVQAIPKPHAGGHPVSVIYLPLTIKEKKLGVLTVQSFQEKAYSDYHLYMLRNIATYTAIALDNASAYETLKSTQQQLIHAEKMASLGELTAGIAHEIQNPLNFVNNFSEVSMELTKEMIDEVDKGHTENVKEIANDLILNLEKINHHGKRADAIVKGMLQHSRSNSGKKEWTDINTLCDEYLRLSYHGLRAKDKTFNASFETNFDTTIGKLNIIAQDIGRVILNLINNAFYAVNEKKKENIPDYQPTISITTRKEKDSVIIKVRDNGEGIPSHIADKIFQPFFTTKPTGQGTGLGLSLSYDIITKVHGGELQMESTPGKGTQFTISLPYA